ncbi:mitochondrial calcium uniporter regulator 1 isoform X2 [Pteropus medius]|uniref:mitochondrial calcium uniporter regulator 1 isoform X2 n=1 Tax=Pteropus vampyrus TaxID=132908 RepID=UPI00196A3043|nr:mitochondrial calcium uniporter regulator 1 isoform X2 [Pteropus giganteus]
MNMQIAAARAHYNSGRARNSLPIAPLPTEQGAGSREAGLNSLAEPETSPAPRLLAPRAPPAGQERAGSGRPRTLAPAFGFRPGPRVTGAGGERHERAPGPVTASGMNCGFVPSGRPKRPTDRRRLLLLLASSCRSLSGCGVLARRCRTALPGGLGVLSPRAPEALSSASRASAVLLLVLVPSPRLAAAAPRRPLGDWERSRREASVPRGGARRCQPGLAPGVARATGALHLCHGRVAALAYSRRELSLSAGYLQLGRKCQDFTSSASRKLYFDTHALVCLLEENGFTTQQAEIIVSALVKITEANMDIIYKDMVTKEITLQQIMSQIASVKKDMIILEKSEFSALRAQNEKVKLELHRLKQQVMDEVMKVRTDTKLDFNLEKSRVKELYSLNERKLLEMRTEMVALHAQQDRAVTQTDRKIDTEVAGLKTMLESHKLDNIKYLAGSVFTCLTVALGFYRLWI